MHRSGTSAITRGIIALGASVGDNLVPEGADNPTGFWEDKDFVGINDRLLEAIGQTYESPALMPTQFGGDDRIYTLALDAAELIKQKLSHSAVWVMKDPRVSRLLPFWKPIFAQVGVEIIYVIAVRHPLSVAESLKVRNDFPIQKSLLLWLEHYVASVCGTRSDRRIFVDYDRLMDDPHPELDRLANALGLAGIARDREGIESFVSGFLSRDLRHTRYSLEHLREMPDLLPDVAVAYQLLHSACRDDVSPVDSLFMARWDRMAADLRAMAPVLALLGERDHAAIVNRVDAQYLAESLASMKQELVDVRQMAQSFEGELNRMRNSLSWRLTQPLRTVRTYVVGSRYQAFRRVTSDSARALWRRMPLSVASKQKLKHALFSCLPFLFRRTQAYRSWLDFSGSDVRTVQGGSKCLTSGLVVADENQYVPLLAGRPLREKPAKLICFYLPQFHPIPENNAWWGEGFTEWANVQPAEPQFAGHYQPHVPGELGYYNLLDPGVQARQVELAKFYGIGGFCFYFYWFGGKRLLEAPIENYLNDPGLDLPFCLCWANENWSRRWDGLDNEILIAQEHSPDDDLEFISHVARYLKDSRYIRINGRPLLLVYRPSSLPSAKETADRWRAWCRSEGIGEIYLAYTQSFETVDPQKYGFDAAIEFPPNNSSPPNVTNNVTPVREDFACTVYDWRIFVERSESYKDPGYKLFRSVCPSWDNTARRRHRGTVFINNTPALYQRWLENAILEMNRQFCEVDEKLVFVNAWNEWAEGAHLEPDQKYGYAWLQATRNALAHSTERPQPQKLVLVSHDAHPHGAQYLALHLAQMLSSGFGFKLDIVLLEGGILRDDFACWGTVHDLSGKDPRGKSAQVLARTFAENGYSTAIVNTTVGGLFLETLARAGLRCVSLIHELRGVIEANRLQPHAEAIADHADMVVFPAATVAESFLDVALVPSDRVQIRHQGLYKSNVFRNDIARARDMLRRTLRLEGDTQIVLGVGYADHRKGIDLFVEAGLEVLKLNSRAYFVWVGHWDGAIRKSVEQRVADSQFADHFMFVGRKDDTDVYYAGADVYALTSREDPFPSVVMESLEVGVPVVAFEGAGGFSELLKRGCGLLVPKEDIHCLAGVLSTLLNDKEMARAMGASGASIVREEFSFRHYVFDLVRWAGVPLKRVSAVVPNYNYAHHLKQRLDSIVEQSYPIYELVVIDDASTDNSLDVIQQSFENCPIDYRVVVNEKNSGSVFKQWRKASDLASGEFLWICEADDFADPSFVERAVEFFDDDRVVMAYTQSRQVGDRGQQLAENYFEYTNDICIHKWQHDHVSEGRQELAWALAVKNSVPNVSGVLFKTDSMRAALELCSEDLSKLRIAGDWLVYSELLKDGKVGYICDPLNSHRRHKQSVTMSSSSCARHLAEIIFMQNRIAELVQLEVRVKKIGHDYVKALYQQFRMDKKYSMNPEQHPEISGILASFYKSRTVARDSLGYTGEA